MKKLRKLSALALALAMVLSISVVGAFAADESSLEAGTYNVSDYYDLPLHINAMGGIDFNTDLLDGASLTVAEDGSAEMTVYFRVSQSLTIYTVPCYAFIDARNSTPGYYDASGTVQDAAYTTATVDSRGNTATDHNGNENVEFVDSVTFPVTIGQDEVILWLYLESNVMGVQFCDGLGSGASDTPGVETPYDGTMTIDWDGILTAYAEGYVPQHDGDEYSDQDSTITYTYSASGSQAGGYEVSIPSTIALGSNTSADYSIKLTTFSDQEEDAYVSVTAPNSGTLQNENGTTLGFKNTLVETHLHEAGQSATGTISISGSAEESGDYTGTLTFTINHYSSGYEDD